MISNGYLDLVIKQDAKQTLWTFSGVLSVFSLSQGENAKKWMKIFPKAGSWRISGKTLSKIDTAGLAFLIECIRHAQEHQLILKFSLPSSGVENLIHAHGVSALIEAHVES